MARYNSLVATSGDLLKPDLAAQINDLPKLKTEELRANWRDLFGKPPHPKLRRELLIPIIAYRLQEKALGGLKPSTLRRLEASRDGSQNKKRRDLMLGARIVREWQGKMYEFITIENGFAWDGRTFQSLSEIARAITGTRWSGPAFFGLKKQRPKEAA